LAKLIGAKGESSAAVLLIMGIGAGLFENALFYFDFLTPYQGDMETLIVMGVFLSWITFQTPRLFSKKNEL
jgi:hypothetical protein